MRTPTEISPFVLLQECAAPTLHGQWKVLVVCMMLNQTSARQVWPIVPGFFTRFPDPGSLAVSDQDEVIRFVRTLGFHNRRSRMLIGMSQAYLSWDGNDVLDLPGVGRYAGDSWHIFCSPREIKHDVMDKELRRYVQWVQGRRNG